MAWFADLAGRAENLLNNLDESTGAVIRNHNFKRPKSEKIDQSQDRGCPLKKRIPPRIPKKIAPVSETKSNISPSRKPSPTQNQSRPQISLLDAKNRPKARKCPVRKPSEQYQHHLNNCPKTMVDDVQGDNENVDQLLYKQRRSSLPLESELRTEGWLFKMQNLEVENAMLKNELNVLNTEVSQLLDKLRIAEDDLETSKLMLQHSEQENKRELLEKESLSSQLDQIRTKVSEITEVQKNHDDEKRRLTSHISLLQESIKDMEERSTAVTKTKDDSEQTRIKLENDLRHAQTTTSDLLSSLDKSNAECQRLERDWEAYKLRVKNMLASKDAEIKALQDGLSTSEDARVLMEQLQSLRNERDELSDVISRTRSECESMKSYLSQVESRHTAAERMVHALRDALREERGARNRVESQLVMYGKELKAVQQETSQTIASLKAALRDKECELNNLRDTTSSIKTANTSALNVADYVQDTIDNEKIHHLTQTLVQRQERIDKLLAENNMLKIQLDKLESKYKADKSLRSNTHSVVNLHSERQRRADTTLQVISNRMAAVIRRHPVFRIFIVIYMICLHLWVMTVLLTHTPESYIPRTARS